MRNSPTANNDEKASVTSSTKSYTAQWTVVALLEHPTEELDHVSSMFRNALEIQPGTDAEGKYKSITEHYLNNQTGILMSMTRSKEQYVIEIPELFSLLQNCVVKLTSLTSIQKTIFLDWLTTCYNNRQRIDALDMYNFIETIPVAA